MPRLDPRFPVPCLTVVLGAVMCAAAAGCGDEGFRHPPRSRVFAEAEWRQRWQAGGSEQDSVVLMPSSLVADDTLVYILETDLHRVAALRLADGGLAWRVGGEGGGPMEFRRPTAIALGPGGDLLVVDQGNGRISVIDRSGSVQRHVRLPEVGYANGLCALDDGTFLLATLATEHPVARVSAAGRATARHELPWPDMPRMPSLPLQGTLAKDGSGGCLYALNLGRGFARYREGRFASRADYVEWFDVPGSTVKPDSGGRRESMAQGLTAAHGVAADERSIAIGFGGGTEDAGRLVDLYDAGTAEYARSLRAPRWFWRMARADDLYVFITRIDGYPAVTAFDVVIQERGG